MGAAWLGGRAARLIRLGPHWPPATVPAAARAASTMRLLSGVSLVLCGLLLLQAPCALGLTPQAGGEGVHVRWGTLGEWH